MKRSILVLAIAILCISIACGQQLTIATYNLRTYSAHTVDSLAGNSWPQRSTYITGLIRFHDFDIFGTQEAMVNQLNYITTKLPVYAYTGVGRDDGKTGGEFSAIFYKKNKFKLLKHGDFWLSQTTDKPNKGWDAAYIRICSWAWFQEIKTGYKFYYFNLHMDNIGVVARRESAKLVLSKIKTIAGNAPTILSGDFNVDQTSESYNVVNTSGILKDAYELSPVKYANNGTFNNFKTEEKTTGRIDHIFVTKDFKVSNYGILTDTYRALSKDSTTYEAKVPSDHFPVMIKVDHK